MRAAAGRLVDGWCGLRLDHFTFVMATGIVSTGLHNTVRVWHADSVPGAAAELLSLILFWIALIGYGVLLSGVAASVVRGGYRVLRDEVVERRCATLAVVAAGGVLAARMIPLGWTTFALVLIVVSAVAWMVLQYGVLGAVVGAASRRTSADDASLRAGLSAFDGTWFLLVVSTQAFAVSLGAWAKAAGGVSGPNGTDLAATFAALAWGLGLLQLVIVAALVAARLLLVGVAPGDEVAPYWVFLGSGAITILGAAEVLGTSEQQIVMPRILVGGVAMAIWAFVTWMILPTVALMLWQRSRPGAIRGYRPALWAMVFPIGMYGESTRELGWVRGTPWLDELGTWESWVALAVWLVVTAGLLGALWRLAAGRAASSAR